MVRQINHRDTEAPRKTKPIFNYYDLYDPPSVTVGGKWYELLSFSAEGRTIYLKVKPITANRD